MTDLSKPPLAFFPADGLSFSWPTPSLPGYPAATSINDAPPCAVEGLNGRAIEGRLGLFDPALGLLNVRVEGSRKPLSLRMDQFRRLRLTEPLCPSAARDARDLAGERPQLPFRIAFKNPPVWQGHTLAPRDESYGLFLFEPLA